MKIKFITEITVVGKSEREYSRKDGQKAVAYSVAVMQDGACCNLPCSEDVYKTVYADLAKPFSVVGYFDDTYNRFYLDAVKGSDPLKSADPVKVAK